MAGKGTTRPYEVPVTIVPANGGDADKRIYLVDATSIDAARRFVSDKFVGEPKLANGKRVAELMSAPHNCRIEATATPPAGGDS